MDNRSKDSLSNTLRLSSRLMKYILAALLCFFVSLSVGAKVSEKQEILNRCTAEFGVAVDTQQNIFAVNRFYVLRLIFTKHGKLADLAVQPRFYFNETHPEWEEPDDFKRLSKSEYEELLERLEPMKPKGRLLKPAPQIGAIANLTARHTVV